MNLVILGVTLFPFFFQAQQFQPAKIEQAGNLNRSLASNFGSSDFEIINLKNQLDLANTQIASLKATQIEIQAIKNENKLLKTQNKNLALRNRLISAENGNLRIQVGQLQVQAARAASLEQKNTFLEQNVNSLQKSLQSIKQVQSKNQNLKSVNENLGGRVNGLQARVTECETKNKTQSKQINEFNSINLKLREHNQILNQENNLLKNQRLKLAGQLRSYKEKALLINKQIKIFNQKTKEINQMRLLLPQYQEQNKTLKNQNVALSKTISEISKQLGDYQSLKKLLPQYQQQNKVLKEQVISLSKTIDSFNKRSSQEPTTVIEETRTEVVSSRIQKENQKLKNQVDVLKQQLNKNLKNKNDVVIAREKILLQNSIIKDLEQKLNESMNLSNQLANANKQDNIKFEGRSNAMTKTILALNKEKILMTTQLTKYQQEIEELKDSS